MGFRTVGWRRGPPVEVEESAGEHGGDLSGRALEVRGDIVGQGPQDARHHDAFLDGQVATVGVGDDAETFLDTTEIRVVAGSGPDAVERGPDDERSPRTSNDAGRNP